MGFIKPELIEPNRFERLLEGKEVKLFTLKNKNGIVTQITNYGGRIVNLWTPDKDDLFEDIVLGYDQLEDYLKAEERYYGAIIGRYANRIRNATFTLEGKQFYLARNMGNDHLHGGNMGFNKVVWEAQLISPQQLVLNYLSVDGDEGYPGNLAVTVRYTLSDEDELNIEFNAKTDKATPINLSHHSYFNLRGAGNGSMLEHLLKINSSGYLPVDAQVIPSGKFALVEKTPMDFRKPIAIGKRIEDSFEQIQLVGGYDHCWVLDKKPKETILSAEVFDPESKRTLSIYTNEPGLQFYSGNYLVDGEKGKNNKLYQRHGAFCLETQHFPDSPNLSHFPNTILYPGETFHSICRYTFGVKNNEELYNK